MPTKRNKKKQPAKKSQPKVAPAKTANGRIIRDLMLSNKVKGNFKDFVIIAGERLLDWCGSYDILSDDGSKVTAKAVALVHKSKLRNIIGEEQARRFWHPGIGRVHAGSGAKS